MGKGCQGFEAFGARTTATMTTTKMHSSGFPFTDELVVACSRSGSEESPSQATC